MPPASDSAYYELGGERCDELTGRLAAAVVQACESDPRFTIVELRAARDDKSFEIVVVDCKCHEVPSKNAVGIQFIERLALVFCLDESRAPETFALRKDFPATEHQNATLEGVPASLCLYFEPWATVARTWTGASHIQRIVVWLSEVAAGTLHRADQPVEQLYFNSRYELVLPAEFRETGLTGDRVLRLFKTASVDNDGGLLVSRVVSADEAGGDDTASCAYMTVGPVVSGVVERPATTLGRLAAQLRDRGSDLVIPLVDAINTVAEPSGLSAKRNNLSLLILRIPILREAGGAVEHYQVQAFVVEQGLGALGEAMELLLLSEGAYYRAPVIGQSPYELPDDALAVSIEPLTVVEDLSQEKARKLTGVADDAADFAGAILGVGSLGSQLLNLWGREGWGRWTLVDHDIIKPHNIPRHTALYDSIGEYKVKHVAELLASSFPKDELEIGAMPTQANLSDPGMLQALGSRDLVVDASTTLHIPRDLASEDSLPRVASVFLTPSGQDCVVLLEDTTRELRIDQIEMQYYRSIIREVWGGAHLKGHLSKSFWVGAGCREVTTVLSPEMIAIHGGQIARRLRLLSQEPYAAAHVWRHDDRSGDVSAEEVLLRPCTTTTCGDWIIVWDEGLRDHVARLRQENLPIETGGVLVGYADQQSRKAYIVDALPAPADSFQSPTSFERGTYGLAADIQEIGDRTAGIVGYLGEWHSHPKGSSSDPSGDDLIQLTFLADQLCVDGQPAFMLIAAEESMSFLMMDQINPSGMYE